MQLEGHVLRLQEQLAGAAALGDEDARRTAEVLAGVAGPAIQLAVLEAVSEAVEEIAAALLDLPGSPSVAVRLDGSELRIDVRAGAPDEPPAPTPPADEGDANARISLRLPEALKARIEAAAGEAGVSVNTWLNRAAASALAGADRPPRGPSGGHRITGWLNA